MTAIRCLLLAALVLLAGCRDVEGVYEPSCIAFAGETITLREGRYEWDRFTDERRLAEDGSVIDPYPDFPRNGNYRVDDQRVELSPAEGGPVESRFLVARDGDLYLVDAPTRDRLEQGEALPDCALRRREFER